MTTRVSTDATLDESAAALFGALASDRRLAPKLAELAAVAGLTTAEAEDALDQLADAKLAEAWTVEGVTSVSLTPLSAWELGLHADEDRRWHGRGGRAKRTPIVRRAWGLSEVGLGSVADPYRLDPRGQWEQVESDPKAVALRRRLRAAEAGIKRFRMTEHEADCTALPRPARFLGETGPWRRWPEKFAKPTDCPGCEGRPLPTWAFCLICSRWGLDHLWRRRTPDVVERRGRKPRAETSKIKFRPSGAGRKEAAVT